MFFNGFSRWTLKDMSWMLCPNGLSRVPWKRYFIVNSLILVLFQVTLLEMKSLFLYSWKGHLLVKNPTFGSVSSWLCFSGGPAGSGASSVEDTQEKEVRLNFKDIICLSECLVCCNKWYTLGCPRKGCFQKIGRSWLRYDRFCSIS